MLDVMSNIAALVFCYFWFHRMTAYYVTSFEVYRCKFYLVRFKMLSWKRPVQSVFGYPHAICVNIQCLKVMMQLFVASGDLCIYLFYVGVEQCEFD